MKPVLIVWLTAVWVLLWGELTVQNVVAGLAVAAIVAVVARPTGTRMASAASLRPLAALRYVAYFLLLLVKANLTVAWEIVTPRSGLNRAIVAVPLHTDSPGINTLVANCVTLTPGTITIDVTTNGADPPTLYIHVLHFAGVEAVRRDVLRLERMAVAAFGTNAQRRAIGAGS